MSSQYSDLYEEWKAQGRPGGSFAAWQASQGGGAPPEVSGAPVSTPQPTPGETTPAPVTPGGTPTPAELRTLAASGRWSEDFDRFSDAQLQAWLSSGLWDPAAGKFRSENDPTGQAIYDKPAECPAGTTFHGSRCVPYNQLPAWAQGSYGQGDTGARAGGATVSVNPLQSVMTNVQGQTGGAKQGIDFKVVDRGGVQGIDPNSVALPSFPSGSTAPLPGGSALPSNRIDAPVPPIGWGSLPNLLAPLNAPAQPPQGGLTNMLNPLQRNRRPNAWF